MEEDYLIKKYLRPMSQYHCSKCNFYTGNKRKFEKHLTTSEHKKEQIASKGRLLKQTIRDKMKLSNLMPHRRIIQGTLGLISGIYRVINEKDSDDSDYNDGDLNKTKKVDDSDSD